MKVRRGSKNLFEIKHNSTSDRVLIEQGKGSYYLNDEPVFPVEGDVVLVEDVKKAIGETIRKHRGTDTLL